METKHSTQPVANDSDDDSRIYELRRLDTHASWYYAADSDDQAVDEATVFATDHSVDVKVMRVWIMDKPLGDVREKIAIVHPQF